MMNDLGFLRKHKGCWIRAEYVDFDERGKWTGEYKFSHWEIYECRCAYYGVDPSQCECWTESEPSETAATLAEAKRKAGKIWKDGSLTRAFLDALEAVATAKAGA